MPGHRLLAQHQLLNLDSSSGLQSLSLLKNRTYFLNKSWSDGILAAHEPYLVTVDKAALVLWNRKTLEPFSVLKEPHIRKMVILTENQEVPGKSSFVGLFIDICFTWPFSVFFPRRKSWVSIVSIGIIPSPNSAGLIANLSISWKYKNLKQFSKLQVHGMTQFAPHNPF